MWYTSVDLPVAEKVARGFETKYPGVSVRVERNGSERLFQRLEQEFASGIHAADVVNTSDGAHFVLWKRAGLLEHYVPIEAAQFMPKDQVDPDGTFMSARVTECDRLQHKSRETKRGAKKFCRSSRPQMDR